ncbi:MAG: TolC family protein [Burkholderiales bacterium]|jgi:outer membrane protein, adhesin transport system|nr:TolC family protein [Burkholderiales bacterium]
MQALRVGMMAGLVGLILGAQWAIAAPQSSNPCESLPLETGTSQAPSLGLDALARRAVETHASVAAKRAAVNAARSEWDAARRQYLPAPSAQTLPGAGGGHSTVLTLEQPVWTGGRISASADAALARSRSADQSVLESQQGLGLAVANVYQAFLQARGRAMVLRQFIGRLDNYHASMRRRVDSGASAQGDLELLQARHALASGQLKSACFAQTSARRQLSLLVGDELSSAEVAGTLQVPDAPDLEDLLERSQQRSPTLRRMDQDMRAARGDADAKAAAQWPTVALVAQRTLPRGVPNVSSSTAVGLQLQYTPGAGFDSLARARSAQAQVEALRASREAARVDLLSKVGAEHEDLRSALSRRQDGLLNVKATANVLASFERLFAVGKRSWLDVMNAARELSDAEQALADIEAQMTPSRYRLALYGGELEWMEPAQ